MKKKIISLLSFVVLFMTLLPTTAFAEGGTAFYIGNAINYDDSNDSLSSSYLTNKLDNITMEAWVKADTLSADENPVRIMYNGNSGSTGYGIYLVNKRPCILMGGVTFATVSEVSLTTSKWYHIAAVRNAGVWKLYVNGTEYEPVNSRSAPVALASGNTFSVGNSTYINENFKGSIDEVRFWTAARTPQQIKDYMYIKLQGDESELLAYYNFDQEGITAGGDNRAIGTVTDVAGGDNPLTISGFALTGDTSNFVSSVKLGNFALENNTYSVSYDGDSVTIPIVRTGGSEGSVTINYQTTDGTAIADTDYRLASGSIIFADGETRKEVSVSILNSSIAEQKTFNFEISAQSGVSIGTPYRANVTILAPKMQDAPVGVATTNSASIGGNGSITGTTAEMQYRTATDENTWYQCTEGLTAVPAGEYWVRYAPKEGFVASPEVRAGKVLEPSATPVAADFTVTDVSVNGGSDGKIEQKNADIAYEYRINDTAVYQDITASKITGLSAGTVQVRKKAVTDENLASATITLYVKQPAVGTPNAADFIVSHVTTYGGSDGSISGVNSTMECQRPNDTTWNRIDGVSISSLSSGEYKIRYREADDTLPSDDITLFVKQPFQNAPSVGAAPATTPGGLGDITGTTAAMEYNNGGAVWTDCADTSTSVAPGTYLVRYKETAENTPSTSAEVTVNPVLPVVNGVNISAMGTALAITGIDDGTQSTIYIDINRNGVVDDNEQSLEAAGVTNAPDDDANLSGYTIYGGGPIGGNYNTQIVMLSGAVKEIFGGRNIGDVTGDTSISISGGSVNDIYGGGHSGSVTGDTHVTVSGGTVAGSIFGGNASGIKKVYVSGNPKIDSIALSTFTDNKVIIAGALTGTNGDIRLSANSITVADGTVLATAMTAAHADADKFAFDSVQAGYRLVDNSTSGTVYIAINSSILTVDPNGGTWNSSTEEQNFTQAYKTTKSVPVPMLTGYTFAGWERTNSYGTMSTLTTDATYTFGSTNAVTDTLTAQWTANSYTVSYNDNKPDRATSNVTGVPTGTDCTYDVDFTLGSAPTLTGYTFDGWYRDAACSVTQRVGDAGENVSNLSDEKDGTVTLYAKWTADTYAITYDSNGGSGTMPNGTATHDVASELPACGITAPMGKYFKEWAIDSADSTTRVAAGSNYTFNRDTTVYAIWEDIPVNRTGDNSQPWLWLGIALPAGLGLAASLSLGRKKRQNR